MILIKGESGCGKSTLLKLLLKQGDFKNLKGNININGRSVQAIDKRSLYDQIAFVNQTNFIFEDTLYNNLCMGEKYDRSVIDKVIDICCLTEFVKEYGLNRTISEYGNNISVGQLQRICIARTLLLKRKCLLLDEPTSALDEETSNRLMKNLLRYTKENDMITICVTHKNDSLIKYDNVVFLDKNE